MKCSLQNWYLGYPYLMLVTSPKLLHRLEMRHRKTLRRLRLVLSHSYLFKNNSQIIVHCILDKGKNSPICQHSLEKLMSLKTLKRERAATDKNLLWLSYALRESKSFCCLPLITEHETTLRSSKGLRTYKKWTVRRGSVTRKSGFKGKIDKDQNTIKEA